MGNSPFLDGPVAVGGARGVPSTALLDGAAPTVRLPIGYRLTGRDRFFPHLEPVRELDPVPQEATAPAYRRQRRRSGAFTGGRRGCCTSA